MSDLVDEYSRFILVCTVVPLGVSALVGLAVGIVQAATQIQEQTIMYTVKLIAVVGTVWMGGERIAAEGLALFARTLESIAVLGVMRR